MEVEKPCILWDRYSYIHTLNYLKLSDWGCHFFLYLPVSLCLPVCVYLCLFVASICMLVFAFACLCFMFVCVHVPHVCVYVCLFVDNVVHTTENNHSVTTRCGCLREWFGRLKV